MDFELVFIANAKDLAMMLHLSLQLFGYQSWVDQDEDPTQVRVRSGPV